jgi:hypothetical protein
MNLVNFQLIDFSDFYNKLFHLDPNSVGNGPFNSQLELMGYGSLYIVQNFGMLCLTLFTPIVARIVALILGLLLKDRTKILKWDLLQLKEMSD